jgi:hypothetical protein
MPAAVTGGITTIQRRHFLHKVRKQQNVMRAGTQSASTKEMEDEKGE